MAASVRTGPVISGQVIRPVRDDPVRDDPPGGSVPQPCNGNKRPATVTETGILTDVPPRRPATVCYRKLLSMAYEGTDTAFIDLASYRHRARCRYVAFAILVRGRRPWLTDILEVLLKTPVQALAFDTMPATIWSNAR
jgi:hypothetical protein